jgi:hypothetical protein
MKKSSRCLDLAASVSFFLFLTVSFAAFCREDKGPILSAVVVDQSKFIKISYQNGDRIIKNEGWPMAVESLAVGDDQASVVWSLMDANPTTREPITAAVGVYFHGRQREPFECGYRGLILDYRLMPKSGQLVLHGEARFAKLHGNLPNS